MVHWRALTIRGFFVTVVYQIFRTLFRLQDDLAEIATLTAFFSMASRGKQNKYPKCLLLNARSLSNKVLDLHLLTSAESFDIIAITETLLDNNVFDHESQLNGFNIYRKDRSGRRGGGVLLAVKSGLTCIRRRDLETTVEMLACQIYTRPSIFLLSVLSFFSVHPNPTKTSWFNSEPFLIIAQLQTYQI